MIKAPRYPDLIDRSNTPLVQAASRFSGVLNVAYHSPTSYAQKHLKRNTSLKAGCHDPLLAAAPHSGMTLMRLHKETVRRQRFLEEKKRQTELEEARQRERVLEERHLRRLEQAKLIRYRNHAINQNQKVEQPRSQRAFSERAFPARAMRSPVTQQLFEAMTTEKQIVTETDQEHNRPDFYKQKQQWSAHEGNEIYLRKRQVKREPPLLINKLDTDSIEKSDQLNELGKFKPLQNVTLEHERSVEHYTSEGRTISYNENTTVISETKAGSPTDREFGGCILLKDDSRKNSIEPVKRFGTLQPLSQDNFDTLNCKQCDRKSTQSEPPLRPRMLKLIQNREEDDLMRNLANLNEKLAALRLKKSIDIGRFGDSDAIEKRDASVIGPSATVLQDSNLQSALPEIRQRRWLVPRLVRTPTAYSRRNRAR